MPGIFEITYSDVERLTDIQLTNVLIKLLYSEAGKNGIYASAVGGSLNITVGDAGEDAHILWSGGVDRTDWLPNRYTLFQCKATNMPPATCKKEFLYKDGNDEIKLKPQVENVLSAGGTYILFYYKGLNDWLIKSRINKFKEALREAGKAYADTADIQIYDANKIAAWANKFIAVKIQICTMLGRPMPGVLTWEEWEKYDDFLTPYETSQLLDEKIRELRNYFTGVKKIARIIGLSGLGKTRLALETFRPPTDIRNDMEQQIRSNQTIYLDANSIEDIVPLIIQWRNNNLTGIIVVDNCDLRLHQALEREIRHSNSQFSLLSLDFSLKKDGSSYPLIELEQIPDSVISNIIKHSYPALPETDVNRIVQFAQGFPQIAVLLAKARLQDAVDIGNLQNDELVDKLLWGHSSPDSDKKEAISACSIFEYVGFEKELAEQRYFVADNICTMDRENFYRYIKEFIDMGIVDHRQRYIRVVPKPLAVRLAADWWRSCSPEKSKKLITEPMPTGMLEALCDQLANLHFLSEARSIIKELCSDQAPFGQAEVLNSEKGSRLFRSLVEVNPIATAECLNKVFGNWNIEQLLTIKEGRRNLVWSIEKLCFWESTFEIAAKIMLKFAAAENETWGNNASNQFLQLYHSLLSGTQASPLARLGVIDYAFQQHERQYRILAVKALGAGLETHWFSRSSGVEKQGSRAPLSDWRPKVWGEIFDYWRECLKRLEIIAQSDDVELANLASEQILDNIRGLVSYGLLKEIKIVITNLLRCRGKYWPEANEKIQEIVTYELPKMPEEGKTLVNEIIKLLEPDSIRDVLVQKISLPPWGNYEKNEGKYVDLAEKAAYDLAHKFVANIGPILANIDILLAGEQRKSFFFGRGLGLEIDNPKPFIDGCLNCVRKIEFKNVNLSVLCGFFAGIQSRFPDVVTSTLNNLAADSQLECFVIDLTRAINPKKEDLERVINIVGANIEKLRPFAYGSILEEVPEEDVEWFCEHISRQGAPWISLDILYLHCFHDTIRFTQFSNILEKTIFAIDIADSKAVELLDVFNWEQTILRLLENARNTNVAKYVSLQLVSLAAANKLNSKLDMPAQALMAKLLIDYQEIVWPLLSKALIEIKPSSTYHDLIDLMRANDFNKAVKKGLIETIDQEVLFEWLRENPENASAITVLLVPVIIEQDSEWSIHPVIQHILDNFGQSDRVIQSMRMNLGTFSWTGSMVPLYELRIKVIASLFNHPIEKVRIWAEQYIEDLRAMIIKEKRIEEEQEITGY